MSLVVGLTGGIASGKSTVSNMLKERGITVIDADIEARLAVEKGEQAYNEIVEYFGTDILQADGSIDRTKLGNIIFNDESKRQKLNSFVHPAVRKRMLKKRDAAIKNGEKIIIMDIPLLVESQLSYMVDKTMLVFVDAGVQLNRLMERNYFTEEEALARIKSQMPLEEKVKLVDVVINNNGSIEDTETQLMKILKEWNIER